MAFEMAAEAPISSAVMKKLTSIAEAYREGRVAVIKITAPDRNPICLSVMLRDTITDEKLEACRAQVVKAYADKNRLLTIADVSVTNYKENFDATLLPERTDRYYLIHDVIHRIWVHKTDLSIYLKRNQDGSLFLDADGNHHYLMLSVRIPGNSINLSSGCIQSTDATTTVLADARFPDVDDWDKYLQSRTIELKDVVFVPADHYWEDIFDPSKRLMVDMAQS